ncbi:MAG: LamG domain-containing protein [Luteolibacter sp.]|uniref:LamG domain-containing protein n=1 Tax=Luteolibacter sp. TaxID=1962973 RepID=UPI0032650977
MNKHASSLLIAAVLLPNLTRVASATTLSYNTGSLGVAGNGTNTDAVVLDQPGAIAAGGDMASGYTLNGYTTVPFLAPLNPAVGSPFTIEFWAKPSSSDTDDAPVSNRISAGNRSGWVFFQRVAGTGWNFRMYNGTGSGLGWDLTGGTSTLNAWSHVVATWDGSSAKLYVNGVLASSTNSGTGVYNASTTAVLSLAIIADGLSSGYNGLLDEVAFYGSALSETKIHDHYTAASSPTAGTYSALVIGDGALEYLQQNPPFASIAKSGLNQIVTFTGILSQSETLAAGSWSDLSVTSPYTVTPIPATPKLFFRAHR